MKKKYFFAVLFSFLLTNLQAQIYDDMESYAGGPLRVTLPYGQIVDGTQADGYFVIYKSSP